MKLVIVIILTYNINNTKTNIEIYSLIYNFMLHTTAETNDKR